LAAIPPKDKENRVREGKESIPEFYSPKDLQSLLGFGESKTYRVFRDLPAYRFGKSLRVKRQDLERWIEANRREPENVSQDLHPDNPEGEAAHG
jgi:excisionase family DNA binding protein